MFRLLELVYDISYTTKVNLYRYYSVLELGVDISCTKNVIFIPPIFGFLNWVVAFPALQI